MTPRFKPQKTRLYCTTKSLSRYSAVLGASSWSQTTEDCLLWPWIVAVYEQDIIRTHPDKYLQRIHYQSSAQDDTCFLPSTPWLFGSSAHCRGKCTHAHTHTHTVHKKRESCHQSVVINRKRTQWRKAADFSLWAAVSLRKMKGEKI